MLLVRNLGSDLPRRAVRLRCKATGNGQQATVTLLPAACCLLPVAYCLRGLSCPPAATCGAGCAEGNWISAAGPSPAPRSAPISETGAGRALESFLINGSFSIARRSSLKSRRSSASRKRRDIASYEAAYGLRGGLGSVLVPPEAGTPVGGPALPGRLLAPGGVVVVVGGLCAWPPAA